MAAVRHLGFVDWVSGQPCKVLDGLYPCAKLGRNRPSTYDNMQVFYFAIWQNIYIHATKIGFGGIVPRKLVMVTTKSIKGTSMHRITSYNAYIVEIGQMVAEILQFFIFLRWRPSAILDLWNAYLDHH